MCGCFTWTTKPTGCRSKLNVKRSKTQRNRELQEGEGHLKETCQGFYPQIHSGFIFQIIYMRNILDNIFCNSASSFIIHCWSKDPAALLLYQWQPGHLMADHQCKLLYYDGFFFLSVLRTHIPTYRCIGLSLHVAISLVLFFSSHITTPETIIYAITVLLYIPLWVCGCMLPIQGRQF